MKMTTNEVNVEGVVLKQTAYKETDMILQVYTKDYGKLSFVAKGVRKLTSKNARAVSPMMISDFSVNLKKGLSTLIKASPINYLRHIKESIESEIARANGKLSNKGFLDKAPKALVDNERAKLDKYIDMRSKLIEQINGL